MKHSSARASVLTVLCALPVMAAAQQPAFDRTAPLPKLTALSRDAEVKMARAAAPAAVSDQATIYVAGAKGYEIAHRGTSGWACFVQRNLSGTMLFPRCDDAERVAAQYPLYFLLEEYRTKGRSADQYEAAVADGYKTGKYRTAAVGALSYMLAEGAIRPHVMVAAPGCQATQLGLANDEQMQDSTLTTIFRGIGTRDCDMVIWTSPESVRHHGVRTGKPI